MTTENEPDAVDDGWEDDPPEAPEADDRTLGRDFEAEGYDPRKDGTVILKLDGVRYRLRRPKYKELREIREAAVHNADDAREVRLEIEARMDALVAPLRERVEEFQSIPDGEATPEQQADAAQTLADLAAVVESDDYRKMQAELVAHRHAGDDTMMEWFYEEILVRLADKRVRIGWDDLPPFAKEQTFIQELLAHWSTVPRRPGVL
jgi:hypothetical protein